MEFSQGLPFKEALEKLDERGVTPSDFDTFQWAMVPTEIRERSFFSSRVESANLLDTMKRYLDNYIAVARDENGHLVAQGRSEFVADMRELAIREGLGKVDPETGEIIPEIIESDLTDIRSIARLQLIFDTQVEAAHEYGYWKQGQNPDILRAYPCSRFIRIRPVMLPRDYHAANEGAVRRKDDLDFWLDMNRDFGVPWGPWGFNSGMGVEDVGRRECIRLGIITEDDVVQPIGRQFNERLQAGVKNMDPGIAAALQRATGGEAAGTALKVRETVADPVAANPWDTLFQNLQEAEKLWKDDLGVEAILTQSPRTGHRWGAKFPSVKKLLEHLQTVGSEMARLVAAMPTLKGKLHTFMAVKSKRGLAHIDGPAPIMSTKAEEWTAQQWANHAAWETAHNRRRVSERINSQVRDNFRHELGHTLTTPQALADFKALAQREGWDKEWIGQNISEYATEKDIEAIAESFGIFTREDYRPGTLPAALENYLKNITL